MKEKRINYNAKTGELEIIEEIEEEIVEETPKEKSEILDDKILKLQNTDTDHEMAIIELANMLMDLLGGGENA